MWLALTARNAGIRASKLVEIENAVAALDFDLACTLRLMHFDNEVAEANAKRIAFEAAQMMFGGGGES